MMPHHARLGVESTNRGKTPALQGSKRVPQRPRFGQPELRLEELESRLAPSTTPSILLTPSLLATLRQEAQANTSQWQSYQSYLNRNLTQIIPSGGAYEASLLTEVADYALGYQVLMNINPTLANQYAGRAMALMQSGLNDYQVGTWMATQYLARGNGSTVSFTLPNTGIIPGTLVVYTAPTIVHAVTHGAVNGQDLVQYYEQFIKVSKTSDGNADYTQGVDWQRNGNYAEADIDWSLASANQPAAGATYYVTSASRQSLTSVSNYTLSGNTITFTAAPGSNQAIFVQYEYGNYQQTSAGDGGFNNIFIDTGYGSRYLGQYESIGLDWLNGYSGMTAAFQAQVENMLQRWFSYVQTNGYYYGSIASNYGAGEYISNVYTALALNNIGYAQGASDLAQMVAFHTNNAVPALTNPSNSLYGGFWAEGWSYGQLAAENDLLAGVALYDAGAISSLAAESQWASQVTQHLITAAPTSSTLYDAGDWYAFPAPFPGKDLFVVLASVDTNATTLSYDNYILQSYPGSPNPTAVNFMYLNPTAPASYWGSAPLQNFASGTGLLTARSDWSNNSVWVSLQMGNLLAADHQTYEPGQLQIQQGGNDLLVDANAYTENQWPKPPYGNTVMVSDNGTGAQTYLWGPGYWYGSPGVVTKAYEVGGNYVYDFGDMSTIYSSAGYPGKGGSVSLLTRQLVYLRPGLIIVYDRVNTTQANFPKNLDWNFMNAPVVNGNSFTETVGASELFGATFSADPLSTIATSYGLNGKTVQEVVTKDTLQTNSVQYVTAFQVGSAGSSMVGTQQVISSDGRMQGVQMGGYVVLFGRYGTLDLSTPISYQVTGTSSLSELLTNLVPGQAYAIMVDGVGLTTVTASSQGTISFTTPAGNHTIQVGDTGSTIGPITHLIVSSPATATAGGSFSVTVQAADAHNNVVTAYAGTVYFTSSDPRALLPSRYTFTNADAGSHTFTFTLDKAGSDSITATDTLTSTLTGSGTVSVTPAAASQLAISGPAASTAGSAFSFTVAAVDAYGNVASGYRGTLAISSTDPGATLPASYTFTAGDAGVHVFAGGAIFDRAGTQTVAVADAVQGALTASWQVRVSAAAASRLLVTAIPTASAGGPFPVTVTAFDPYGNTATAYAGTVRFTSSDSTATLPAAYTFTAGDAGSHTFSATMQNSGTQTVTASDGTLSNTASISVIPATAPHLSITGPSTAISGTAFSITVTAYNADGTVDSAYTGTVHFASTDPSAVLPRDYTFQAGEGGRHTFQLTLKRAGTQTVTVSDTAGSALSAQLAVAVSRKLSSTAPVTQQMAPNSTLAFSSSGGNAITVSDGGVGLEPLQETLTVSSGTVSLGSAAGLVFSNGGPNNSTTMVFIGTSGSINAALNTITFHPANGFTGNVTLTATTADPVAGSPAASSTVNITVTSAPPPPHAGGQGSLVAVGSGASQVLFAVTPGGTLYEHVNAIGWVPLGNYIQSVSAVVTTAAANITQITASNVVLYAVTQGRALVRYDSTSGWQVIGGSGSVTAVSAGTDASGHAVAFVITTDGSFMEFRDVSGWDTTPVGGRGTVMAMQAGSANHVVVITADHSIFEHDDTYGWYPLSGPNFAQSVSFVTEASGNQVLFAVTLGNSLFRFDQHGWTKLGNNIVSASAGVDVNGNADVFAVTEKQNFVEWHGAMVSTLATPAAGVALTSAATSDEAFIVGADGSIDEYSPIWGWLPFAGGGFART